MKLLVSTFLIAILCIFHTVGSVGLKFGYLSILGLNSKEAVYFSNRAACHYKMNNFNEALSDANTCISMDRTLVRVSSC